MFHFRFRKRYFQISNEQRVLPGDAIILYAVRIKNKETSIITMRGAKKDQHTEGSVILISISVIVITSSTMALFSIHVPEDNFPDPAISSVGHEFGLGSCRPYPNLLISRA